MKTSEITINGKTYLLCMSNRVLRAVEEKGTSLQNLLEQENKTTTNICWLMQAMSEAGRVYAAMSGLGKYEAISEEDILDASGPEDYAAYMDAMRKAMGERTVDAEPPKNAETAHGEALNG